MKTKFSSLFNAASPIHQNLEQLPFMQYRQWLDELEYACQDSFWNVELHIQMYAPFINLSVFEDKIIEQSKLDYYKFHPIVVSKERWIIFVEDLMKIFLRIMPFQKNTHQEKQSDSYKK